jgi:hypothetical protein
MRLPLLVCLTIAMSAVPGPGAAAPAQHHGRSGFHPPTRCPELRADGFCPYDSGWRPAADNPLFAPLRRSDPHAASAPTCWATDSRGRTLIDYETENPAPAMRIGGRLVRFRPAASDSVDRYIAPEGRLTIREGAVVAQAHEFQAVRATLTFVDRSGRAHVASVRLSCGV